LESGDELVNGFFVLDEARFGNFQRSSKQYTKRTDFKQMNGSRKFTVEKVQKYQTDTECAISAHGDGIGMVYGGATRGVTRRPRVLRTI
jgi:hypothetical protein